MKIRKCIKKALCYIIKGSPQMAVKPNISCIDYGHIFSGKKCIITGGSRGIGFQIAKRWIECGGEAIISGRDIDRLEEAKKDLGESCHTIVFDSTDIEHIPGFYSKARDISGGDIDALVCNAGMFLYEKDIFHVDYNGYRKQFLTNLDGYYFLAKVFLEGMDKNKEHNILMISSELGLQESDIPYGLTKASVNSLVKGLSRRFYSCGVRVNAIAPGVTVTDMSPGTSREDLYASGCASQRNFLPEEIAETAVFLLSDASKCISGEVIACDAGNYLDSHIHENMLVF